MRGGCQENILQKVMYNQDVMYTLQILLKYDSYESKAADLSLLKGLGV